MSLSAYELLQHIRDEVNYLLEKSSNLEFEEFSEDPTLVRAFSRSIEIIGEATKKLPSKFKDKYPDIPWRNIAGMRDKLIHDYFGVDLEIIWDVVITKIPELKDHLTQLFEDFK